MDKEQIIEYLYENNVRGDLTIEQMAEDLADRKTENCSEKPNNCEHITEDGVTCAKYPACDDCLDNPLNKVKGSKRLLKGYHEKEDEPQTDDFQDWKDQMWTEAVIESQKEREGE